MLENRRGAGRDRFGNWYWIDETSLKIRVRSRGSGEATDFWPLEQSCLVSEGQSHWATSRRSMKSNPQHRSALSGLAITEDHYLVVGVIEPAGLLIFDLHTGGNRDRYSGQRRSPFVPFDMAARPGGGVFILDRVESQLLGARSSLQRHCR